MNRQVQFSAGVVLGAVLGLIGAPWLSKPATTQAGKTSLNGEEVSSGRAVFLLAADPDLDCPAACTVVGDTVTDRKWTFLFREHDDFQRAYEAIRNAATGEQRRALHWP